MRSDRGAVLLLFLLVVFVFGLSVWLAQANITARPDPDAAYQRALAEAKAQLLVHAVANVARPGWLPYPDRRADGNYDGSGDCVSTFGLASGVHIVGLWPFVREQGCVIPLAASPEALPVEILDPNGNRLWLAVSKNLVWNRPGIDGAQWLSVRTPAGVISGVAAVVLSPGPALAGQTRGTGIGDYLEGISANGVVSSNADGDLEFVAAASTTQFNDRLIYLTASELMTEVTRHVADEIKKALDGMGPYPPGLPHSITPWYHPFWSSVTTYVPVSASVAHLTFQGCPSLIYEIDPTASAAHALPPGGRC